MTLSVLALWFIKHRQKSRCQQMDKMMGSCKVWFDKLLTTCCVKGMWEPHKLRKAEGQYQEQISRNTSLSRRLYRCNILTWARFHNPTSANVSTYSIPVHPGYPQHLSCAQENGGFSERYMFQVQNLFIPFTCQFEGFWKQICNAFMIAAFEIYTIREWDCVGLLCLKTWLLSYEMISRYSAKLFSFWLRY